jgi:predicted small secreted protein
VRRVVAVGLALVAVGTLLASCSTVLGATKGTQQSLFCLATSNTTRNAVYQLVGSPSASSSSWVHLPPLFAHVNSTESTAAGDSWAEWTGPPASYLVVFHRGSVQRVEQGVQHHVTTNWAC